MTFNIYTLGCKVNTYESEALIDFLEQKGFQLSSNDEEADVIIVNTCTVTSTSDNKSKKLLRQLARNNPNAIVVAMGCYAQLNKEEANDYANIVIGTTNRLQIYNLIMSYLETKQQLNIVDQYFQKASYEDMKLSKLSKHSRGFIKIQDGCENFCAYCAIPYSRGPIRSREVGSIIEEITSLTKSGVKEVILSGINTGTYGKDLENMNLAKLIEKICLETSIYRIRLSSIELMEVTDELLMVINKYQTRIAMHLHIPLQAGNDNTLVRMERKYLTKDYEHLINKIRQLFPDIAITTDCLAGFVGETQEDFQGALAFIEKINFAGMHVFPYSRRKGTKADLMMGHLAPKTIQTRTRIMLDLAKKMKDAYQDKFINQELDVLFETRKNNQWFGHTSNYLEVMVDYQGDLTNKVVKVKILGKAAERMKGVIV